MSKTDTKVITVTEDDIEQGLPDSPYCCPIARAASRILNEPGVSGYEISSLSWDGRRKHWPLPQEARDFVKNFDSDEKRDLCKPFTFTISEVIKFKR